MPSKANVTWGDDSLRIRLFQTAVRVSAHFYDAVARSPVGNNLEAHLDNLNNRWRFLKGDQKVIEYERSLQKELLPLVGQPVFDYIRQALAKPFAYESRLWGLNEAALKQVRECVRTWGGPKAKKRLKKLRLLPLHCESTASDYTEFFFERNTNSVLVRAGSPKDLLLESMLLEFSFFHEYLSHAFPSWTDDVEQISEGWLFALEFDWFWSRYTLLDNDLIMKVWQRRLEPERRSFWAAQWLLRRCKSPDCVRRFLLEWVGGWADFDQNANLDLLSQLEGVHNKIGYGLGRGLTAKQLKTQEILDATLCDPCEKGSWNISSMVSQLGSALRAYTPK
jgi:hypothetical protein